jgi:hypothetical protein
VVQGYETIWLSGDTRTDKKRARKLMLKFLTSLTLFLAVLIPSTSFACEATPECDKCAPDSEFTWNPDSRFVTPRLQRFYSLEDQIDAAYQSKDHGKAQELAQEYLQLAAIYRCNWNYGNAIHNTNQVLGLISLENGDIDAATQFLLLAGKSTGSPQLNTFGPQLILANELLKRGRVDVVKAYLQDIKSFWEGDRGKVDAWLTALDKGDKPDLDRDKPASFLLVLFWLFALWPVIAATAFLYTDRHRIRRKLLFLTAAIVSGYVTMYAINWISEIALAHLLANIADISEATLVFVATSPIWLSILLPALVIYALVRQFRSSKILLPGTTNK